MRGTLRSAGSVAAVALLVQGCAGAMEPEGRPVAAGAAVLSYGIYGTESYFSVESEPAERRGRPLVTGYVTNNWGLATRNVRLRVDALDAAGNATATYIGYVNGMVNPGGRVYFEVPVQTKAPSYRVTVLSYEPVHGHGN